ncbi:MAG: flippase-like domain-containing protein [Paludibacteraceae bacterium]|nr:flippase-like domain-containing protein [Paludibacteraceae bacterium]
MSDNSKTGKNWLTVLKIVIMAGAYGYLAYVLITFDKYNELADSLSNIDGKHWAILLLTIILMPLNWAVESLKWKTLVNQIQEMPFLKAFKSVLMGLASGFFTPNRICDPIGRILLLDNGNKSKGVMFSIVSTIAQSFAGCIFLLIAIIAIPSAHFDISESLVGLQGFALIFISIITLIYFTIPLWSGKISVPKYEMLDRFFRAIDSVSYTVLMKVSAQSILRYGVYSFQYYLTLRFFSVDISLTEALILIPINYFLISVTPSVSFSEIGIRGAYASLLIGSITANQVGAALAAVTVWFINYVIPMIVGSIFVAKHKQ